MAIIKNRGLQQFVMLNKLVLNGAVTGKDLWIARICNITTKGMERILFEKVLKT